MTAGTTLSECRADALVAPFESALGDWYVLLTRSRQEKALAESLSARRVSHFLPVLRKNRLYGNRKAVVEQPMFPGYIFLKGSFDDVHEADRTRRVARILQVGDQQGLQSELKNLWLAIKNRVALDPFPYLRTGMRAEVRSGPLRGLEGVVERRLGVSRLVLQVQMLGRAVAVEVDAALLDPL
jgi:transcription antitermination factor NusG